jgi:uncharacterized protein (DUF1800 family)
VAEAGRQTHVAAPVVIASGGNEGVQMANDPGLRALNRFGLGARAGERASVRDARSWLEQQLDGPPPTLASRMLPAREQIAGAMQALRRAQRDRRPEGLVSARAALRQIGAAEAGAALTERIVTARPFVERLIAFWSNHLCVSVTARPALAGLAGL